MDPRQKFALMEKIIRELEDLKKSQSSVLKKITQIEADNINLGAELLADELPGIHEGIDNGLQKVSQLLEQFTEYRDKFEKDNQGLLTEPPAS